MKYKYNKNNNDNFVSSAVLCLLKLHVEVQNIIELWTFDTSIKSTDYFVLLWDCA